NAVRSYRASCGAGVREFCKDLIAGCGQRIDAQIKRRTCGKAGHFTHPSLAKGSLYKRDTPVRAVRPNRVWSISKIAGVEQRQLYVTQRRRCEPVALKRLIYRSAVHLALEDHGAEGKRTTALAVEQPACGTLAPESIVDNVADGGAVARASKAMGGAPILQRICRRTVLGLKIIKDFNCCCQPAAKAHVSLQYRLPVLECGLNASGPEHKRQLCPGCVLRLCLDDDDLRADRNALIEIDDVVVEHAYAAA